MAEHQAYTGEYDRKIVKANTTDKVIDFSDGLVLSSPKYYAKMEDISNLKVPANVRKCANYDPVQHLMKISYADSGTEALYLVVKERVRWFNVFCAENRYDSLIDDSDIRFFPTISGGGQIVATCSVFIQGKLVGKSSAGVPLTGNYADDKIAVQSAATSAKGRALANAGFDISDIGTPSEDGDGFPCDTGLVISGEYVNPLKKRLHGGHDSGADRPDNGSNGGYDNFAFYMGDPAPAPEPEPEPAPAPVPVPATAPAVTSARRRAETSEKPMSREEALRFVIPTGQYQGKTMGELMGEDPSRVEFYAKKYNGRNHDLKAAAQAIMSPT